MYDERPSQDVFIRSIARTAFARAQFQERFQVRFYDPAFKGEREAIARLEAIAWEALPGADLLVPVAEPAEADDGPPGLR